MPTSKFDTEIYKKIAIAFGSLDGFQDKHILGADHDVAASSTEDVTEDGVITFLEAPTTVRIKAGGNAADDASGAGAREITLEGLDENWDQITETITTAGASASSVTTNQFIRVTRAYCSSVGTYTGNNTGEIVIENGTGGTDLLGIEAGIGASETSEYSIPAGWHGFITRVSAHVDASKACDMKMWERFNADDASVPYSGAKIIITEFPQLIGEAEEHFDAFVYIPPKSDVWWTATTGGGASASVEVDYDIFLVKDGYV